ncbi:MAG: STAS domain-containing protein [Planctomycetota bacterium]
MKGFVVQELQGTDVVAFSVLDKYLNYDISEPLKAQLREAVAEWQSRGCRHFVLDLGKVSIVDSCGVGVLISLHNTVKASGGELFLVRLTPFIHKILRMMHLESYFQVGETEDEVLQEIGVRKA